MHSTSRTPNRRSIRATARLLGLAGLGGGGLTLAGCAAAAGLAVAAVAAVLTGLFLTSIQASFAATAHSYAFTDAGNAQFLFNITESGTPSLLNLTGRLPGFHLVIITGADKAMIAAQEDDPDAKVFETDVIIDFSRSPPTISGTVTERGGDLAFALDDLYPDIDSPTLELRSGSSQGQYEIRLNIQARNEEGDQLDYSLVMDASLSEDGLRLGGPVEVERVLTPVGGTPLETTGSGQFDGQKQTGDQPDPNDNEDDAAPINDNTDDEPANDNEADNDNGSGDDNGAGNDNGADNDNADVEQIITAEDCPELPRTVVAFLNQLLGDIGVDALDVDGDGAITADEVHEVADPVSDPFVLTNEAVVCIIRVVNN